MTIYRFILSLLWLAITIPLGAIACNASWINQYLNFKDALNHGVLVMPLVLWCAFSVTMFMHYTMYQRIFGESGRYEYK